MIGLSSKVKEALGSVVENIFDNIALDFIGDIPRLREKKRLVISSQRHFGLAHLFVQAMGNKSPNPIEQDVLGSLLNSSHGYIESLKNKVKSNIVERIDGLSREASIRKGKMKREDVQQAIEEETQKAKSQMKAIAEAESTKLRNLGTMMDISRIAGSIGDSDPTVFFVVIRDGVTCQECVKLHLMPDQITPRLWKFSDLKQGYHKRGEENASAFGLHPHCRCLYQGNQPVITEKGIKPLKNIEVGERVLTHTGKFKKVTATFGKDGIETQENLYRIEFISPDNKIRTIRVTADHLMLTQNGWVRADQLIPNKDCFQYLFKECEFCKIPFAYSIGKPNKRFCSIKCNHEFKKLNNLYSTNEGRVQPPEEIAKRTKAIVAAKHKKSEDLGKRSVKKFICEECNIEFEIAMGYWSKKSDRWVYRKKPRFCSASCNSKNITKKQWSNEYHRENIATKNRESILLQYSSGSRDVNMGEARKALYKMGRGGSKDQRKLFDIIKNIYSDAESEYPIDKYFADVAIPSMKTVIEWDGGGHWLSVYRGDKTLEQKIEEDRIRDEIMNSIGWHVLRYNEESGFKSVLEDIRRVSLNSTSGYSFRNVQIKSITVVPKYKVSKTARLYDITVEDDSSFIVMGVVSHNCTLTYLSKGFGFDEQGYVSYVGENHDAYGSQE